MTLIMLMVLVAAGGFGYLVYKHGYQAAAAAVVATGAGIVAALSGLFDMFQG